LRISLEARDIATATRDHIGEPPSALRPAKDGTLWAVITQLQATAERLDGTCAAILARLDAEAARTHGVWGWLGARMERLVDVLLTAALVAILAYLGGFHR